MSRKLDDPELQQKFLDLIRNGVPRGKAAKKCEITSTTVRSYFNYNPDFYEAFLDAKEDCFDPVEKTTRQLAIAGDISAIKEYRTMTRQREVEENRRQVMEHQHQVQISATAQAVELIGILRERHQSKAILELEPIE